MAGSLAAPLSLRPHCPLQVWSASSQMGTHHAMLPVTNPLALVRGTAGIVELPVTVAPPVHKLPYVLISQGVLGVGDPLEEPRVRPKAVLQRKQTARQQ